MNRFFLAMLLRFCAAVIALATLVLLIVQIAAAMRAGGAVDWPAMIFPPLIAIALSLGMVGIASAMIGADQLPPEIARSLTRMQTHLSELQRRVDDVALASDRISRKVALPPPPPAPMHVTATVPSESFDPLLKAIAEVRELALLTDVERRERLTRMTHDRKRMLVRQVIDHMEKHEWSLGNAVLRTLDEEFPEDVEVRRTRTHFQDSRANAEVGTINRVRDQVENFLAIGAHDNALAAAQKLTTDFPANTEALRILAKVTREREMHVESSVARMVEEIRHDIDRRLWRRSLLHAQRLVERFPEHEKTKRIVEQLETLQTNAEIEERQELEVRIQELIRGHQFQEAIDLSEELLMRFPNSPQAEAIESMLPRIRAMAAEPQDGISSLPPSEDRSATGT